MPDMEFNTTAGQTVDRELFGGVSQYGGQFYTCLESLGDPCHRQFYGIRLAGGLYKGYPGDHQNQHEKADHHTEL